MISHTVYEWDFEQLDEYGDIVEHWHHDSLKEVEKCKVTEKKPLCLVKFKGFCVNGLAMNDHAYVKDNKLPTSFDDGSKVPQKYIKEFERWINE